MVTGSVKPEERTFTEKEAEKSFAEIMQLVKTGVRVRIVVGERDVCIMESPEPKSYKLSDIAKRLKASPIPRPDDQFADDLEAVINLKRPPSRPLKWD